MKEERGKTAVVVVAAAAVIVVAAAAVVVVLYDDRRRWRHRRDLRVDCHQRYRRYDVVACWDHFRRNFCQTTNRRRHGVRRR